MRQKDRKGCLVPEPSGTAFPFVFLKMVELEECDISLCCVHVFLLSSVVGSVLKMHLKYIF